MRARAAALLALLACAAAAPYYTTLHIKACADAQCTKCAPERNVDNGACGALNSFPTPNASSFSFSLTPADDGRSASLQVFWGAANCSRPAAAVAVAATGNDCSPVATPAFTGYVLVGPVAPWWVILLISLASLAMAALLCWCWCRRCCRRNQQSAGEGPPGVAPAARPPYHYNAPPELAATPAPPPYMPPPPNYAVYYGAQGGGAQAGAPGSGAPGYAPPPPSGVAYGGMPAPGATYGGPPGGVTYNV